MDVEHLEKERTSSVLATTIWAVGGDYALCERPLVDFTVARTLMCISDIIAEDKQNMVMHALPRLFGEQLLCWSVNAVSTLDDFNFS